MMPRPSRGLLPRPKKRLPVRGPQMTFIVGMKCSGGLVLCADTLESDGVTKRYRQKITNVSEPDWGLCWAGSGTAYTVDKFSDKLKQVLKGKPYNRSAIENDIEVCLELLRQSYSSEHQITVVLGLFGTPQKADANDPDPAPEYHLYRGSSSSACVALEKEYCCAGMDVTLASFVLSNTHHWMMPVEHGIRLGLFVTALMKEHADGVGGPTDAFFYDVRNAIWVPVTSGEVRYWEVKIPTDAFDESVSRFWLDQPDNKNLDELATTLIKHKKIIGDIFKNPLDK